MQRAKLFAYVKNNIDIKRILQNKQFHLQLKSEQKEIIQNVLERKDSMAECYQRASERQGKVIFFPMVICNSLLLLKSFGLPINVINCIKFYVIKCKSMRKPCKPPKNLYNEYYSCLTFYVFSVRDHVRRFICKVIWKMVTS